MSEAQPRQPRSRTAASAPKGMSAKESTPISVLIVDDHPLFRDGLVARISREPDMEVCGEAESIEGALPVIESDEPAVVVLDIALKDGYGLKLIENIRETKPETRILVLSAYREELFGRRAIRLGADGYLNKKQAHGQVIDAIRSVASGKRYLSARLTERLLDDVVDTPSAGPVTTESLTERELEILRLIGEGSSTRSIAGKLGLSVHTIETYREKIRSKLGLKNGTELVHFAVQWVLESQ